jgi:sulfur carrier protein
MKVRVKLFATLRNGRFEEEVREYGADTSVDQVLEDLNIRQTELKIVFVNNRRVLLDYTLADGDVLGIFPPIGGG